ncbi:hypothetical protein ABK040_002803 [Willaertia magna]
MKRKSIAFIHNKNRIPIDKKVKILNEMEQSLQQNYLNSTECNSIMSFSDYIDYFNYFLKFRNSEQFKNLNVDVLLQIIKYLQFNDKIAMIYVCKNWFKKFNNSDYFWNSLLSLLSIENKNFTKNQIRDYILLKIKYFNKFKRKERKYFHCSSDNSELSDMDEGTISIDFNDNFYFEATFKYYSGCCGYGNSTAYNYKIDLSGVYFEPTSLQHVFLYLNVDISTDIESGDCNEGKFSLVAKFKGHKYHGPVGGNERHEEDLEIIEMEFSNDSYYVIHSEALRKLVRDCLKLKGINNELDWLKEFLENKIPKESMCKQILNEWPLSNSTNEGEEEEYY